jgi:glycosyltransferase involved in cell wall biosynthesis
MHIVQVTPRFPPAIGGVEEHVYRISLELSKRGHKVSVVTSDDIDGKSNSVQTENVKGIGVYRFPLFMSKLTRELWFIPGILQILGQIKGDVVHVHGYRCLSSCTAASLSRLNHVPVILTPHGIYPSRSVSNVLLKAVFDHTAGRLLLNFSDRIIALSEHNVRLIMQLGASADKITVVPNGVNTEEYAHERSQKILNELGSGGPILLYVGRIDWNKQVDKVIESMPLILKEFPSAKFVVVGPDYANLSSTLLGLASRLGVKHSLVMAGKVSASKLKEFYSSADIFVLPSSYEGFGLSMLEAMASRIPVVVSSFGGPGDILKHRVHAWLLQSVTPDEIVRSVHEILTDRHLRETLVDNAFELIKRKYTWEKVVDKLELIYSQAISKSTCKR